ncbi:hypothetical protein HPB47_001174 [Ixodes persulcatus]|uniref:Uncharacterized protein n=1 Tax=Ixodes persulcatus TaxID=34615 RepID=A0AC60PPQ2_IXOPE|nr:hypothetical protein HPB47_001174 [Ixodes persulcatus]
MSPTRRPPVRRHRLQGTRLTHSMDAGDGTAVDFATETVKRRLSDPEQRTDRSPQQAERPWLVATGKKGRRAGRSCSSSLPSDEYVDSDNPEWAQRDERGRKRSDKWKRNGDEYTNAAGRVLTLLGYKLDRQLGDVKAGFREYCRSANTGANPWRPTTGFWTPFIAGNSAGSTASWARREPSVA